MILCTESRSIKSSSKK